MIVKSIVGYEEQVWEILKNANEECIPPLSSRESTRQMNFREGDLKEPVSYFEEDEETKFLIMG